MLQRQSAASTDVPQTLTGLVLNVFRHVEGKQLRVRRSPAPKHAKADIIEGIDRALTSPKLARSRDRAAADSGASQRG